MTKNENFPSLRFKGFTYAWEQQRLGEIIKFYECKTTKENEYPVLSSTMSGIYLQREYFNQEVSTLTNKGYKVVPFGYVTYRSMSDTNVFHFNVQKIIEKGIVSPAYPVFTVMFGNVADYLTYYMNENQKFKNQITISKEGGTRYALSGKKLSNLKAMFPSQAEQLCISNFFLKLDSLITLHQRKRKKQLKKE